MQRDPLFIFLFTLVTIAIASGASLLIYTISQKGAAASEENVQNQIATAARLFEIAGVQGSQLYIKNIGTEEIADMQVYVDGAEANAVFEPIAPNTVGAVRLSRTGKAIKVVVRGFSQEWSG